ncbi:unnamed protein product [Ceratitis capitata]|uniref:(Mediterranean fruit fly) hypothetical protein n=1 Tax=Ceratitis capitata TaxID=7213 RepID=A0A811U6M6_CERCA|nr:unnamed protein product [Ceratitis capitata]
MEIVETCRHGSTYLYSEELKISQKTVWNHWHILRFKKKLKVLVPHELTQKNIMDRIFICESLLNRNKTDPFLKRIVTYDEKSEDRIDGQEGFAVCLVGLAKNHLLRAVPLWPNTQFGPLLPKNGPLEGSTHPEKAIFDQQRANCVQTGQRQATHVFGDAPEAPGAQMGGPNAPIL